MLIGLGIIQIEAIKLVVPQLYLGYLLLGLVLVLSLITTLLLNRQNAELQDELKRVHLQIEILRDQAFPSFFIEDVALSSVMAHVELRKKTGENSYIVINPCQYLETPPYGCVVDNRCIVGQAGAEYEETHITQVPIPGAQAGNLKKDVRLVK